MSVSNFELNITSRVTAGDTPSEGSPSLVWQPSLMLWRPDEIAPIVGDSAAPQMSSLLAFGAAVEPADLRGATVLPATLTHPTRTLARTNASGQGKGKWRRIWRGDSSLAQIFCCYALFHIICTAILSNPPWEELASFGLFYVCVFAALVALLLGGGLVMLRALWRSTLRYAIDGGAALFCGLARGAALVLLIASAHMAILTCAPRLIELANIATGVIPTGNYRLNLVRGGTELAIDGAIGIGLSKKVAQVLDRHPLVQALQLNSSGGSARESRKLRDLIVARKLSTTTSQGCYGVCTLAYMAGEPEQIGEQASLRSYRSAQPGMPDRGLRRNVERDRRDWLARGVPAVFADQALSVRGPNGWEPSNNELVAAKIVNPSPGSGQPQSEHNQKDMLAALDSELRQAQFFTLLKEQEPASYRTLVGEIHAELQSSANARNFHLPIHPMAKAASYARLAHAEDTLLLDYAEMILEQISLLYSDSAKVCNHLFGMDLSGAALETTKYFSAATLAKETNLMVEVLRSSAAREYRPPARQAIEARWNMIMALIGKRYGAKAVLLFDTHQTNRDPGQTCHVLWEFYKAVTRLPAHEAGPLLRYHFAQLQARALPRAVPSNMAKQVMSLSLRAANGRSAH